MLPFIVRSPLRGPLPRSVLRAISAALPSVMLAVFVGPGSSQAQIVNRDRGADAESETSDGDDILAPIGADRPAARAPETRDVQVGLVPLVPLSTVGKTIAGQVTTELLKQLDDGQVFGATLLEVNAPQMSSDGEGSSRRAAADGAASLARGESLLKKLQFGKARAAFEAALAQLGRGASVLADVNGLVAAHLGLAEVAARQGQEDAADAQLARAAALNPELQLDKKRFPPQFVRSFARARDAVLTGNRGAVVVDASATGAPIEVDGRSVAPAPVTVTALPRGRHLVRAVREGLPPWGALVDVDAGATVTVSPGFLATGGTSWFDELQNNRLDPRTVGPVAAAARAKGLKAAVLGVVSKADAFITVQLVLVDAVSGKAAKLPSVTFQADLLDVSIETLKARESMEEILGRQPFEAAFDTIAFPSLVEGAVTAERAQMRTVPMLYDVKVSPDRGDSRVFGADASNMDEGDSADDDERTVLSAGKGGKRKRLDDDTDPYANRGVGGADVNDPDAPLVEQPWFMPAVIGGSVAATVLLGGTAVASLIALKVLPDPRPARGGTVTLTLP